MPDDNLFTHRLSRYDLGESITTACQYDQRFSYCTYVPAQFSPACAKNFRLLVAVHGTDRANQMLRSSFTQLAEKHNFIVLAPQFPAGIGNIRDIHNYKHILYEDIRFDQVLLHMVGEVERKYGFPSARFALFGFSGGGHFVHRFLYLHPEKLLAACVAAPGSVTLITDDYDWWLGTANFETIFGKRLDIGQIREVPILLSVGAEDISTDGIISGPDSSLWMEGVEITGANRVERLHSLYHNMKDHCLNVRLDVLPGVKHNPLPHTINSQKYFADILSKGTHDLGRSS